MCGEECIGNYYRGCGHYIRAYYTGVTTDCGSPTCGLSSAHMHKVPNCGCNVVVTDFRRVGNLYETACDACKAEYFAATVGR